ncbi:cytochrome d ubiquinol oxidase subunit II [Corynebacterium sp. UMB4614]|uniref:cytochrome d ubiquinol oxidase subunit II n=1 Tax=Corynebacterium sp. UMB4614 TaxID=3046334 RepID=UPI00254B1762|nr:cytochrome d ubiquinol oxidase subunit II [Corynebacterium sp. UMB4614]MDK7135284.1 cytochrome d ubiquinol oxidase subunit II [Corynebacterium sp. UMB4614]
MSIDLPTLWFGLIVFLFAGYFMLEGFGFGVGLLLPFLGRDEARRSAMIRTIGPVWDGNEVWLITAGGALFAAFPAWYADMFSGFYLPLFLILLGLIVRIVGLEWRTKVNSAKWRACCDAGIVTGSWISPIVWGVAVANLVSGIPENAAHVYPLFHPYALVGAAALVCVFALHGLTFIRLKTAGVLRKEAQRFITPLAVGSIVFGGVFALWTQLGYGKAWTWVPLVLAVVGLLGSVAATVAQRDGWAFTATALAIVSVVVLAFGAMFPMLWTDLDIWQAASNPYTLKVMTWAGVIVTPFVLLYQGYTYWIFRRRIVAEPVHL